MAIAFTAQTERSPVGLLRARIRGLCDLALGCDVRVVRCPRALRPAPCSPCQAPNGNRRVAAPVPAASSSQSTHRCLRRARRALPQPPLGDRVLVGWFSGHGSPWSDKGPRLRRQEVLRTGEPQHSPDEGPRHRRCTHAR